jgi:thymidylate synthase
MTHSYEKTYKNVQKELSLLFQSGPHPEEQYCTLINDILQKGFKETGRNGNTRSIFGASMRFSLQNGVIPIFTTKRIAWKTCLKELLWFIHGETDNRLLQNQNVHIWDANSSRDFLDSRGLDKNPEGMLGPIYGYQWRHFNAAYDKSTGKLSSENNRGIDQLQSIIDQLKNPATRNSRRLIMTAWNPLQLDEMALPPCHVMCQFNVHEENKLSCALYQRSCDMALGVPFNVASYSFLTHLIAKHCGLEAFEFVYFMGNCHLYEEHCINNKNVLKPSIIKQLQRTPYPFPILSINKMRENINDYILEDFTINNYQCHSAIKMEMIV